MKIHILPKVDKVPLFLMYFFIWNSRNVPPNPKISWSGTYQIQGFSALYFQACMYTIDCLEHKSAKYMLLTHEKRV